MRALVTGARGFLAQAVVNQLVASGAEVRCLARATTTETDRRDVEWVYGDLRDGIVTRDACRGIDAVFHVGGVAGLWGSWLYYRDNNVLATLNVIDGCRAHRVCKLVFTSSPSVTFDGRAQENANEDVGYARRWLTHYAHSKALAEQEVLRASSPQLATCALRPHTIWGPGDRHLLPRIVDRARSGRLRQVGDGHNRIDMTYVDNAASAHLQAVQALAPGSALAGRAYYISQGEPVNCWQWINEVLSLADIPPVVKSISLGSAWYLGAACELGFRSLRISAEPPMTRYLAALLRRSHYFDISRARQDFCYEPRVSTAEGMQRLGDYLRRQAKLPS